MSRLFTLLVFCLLFVLLLSISPTTGPSGGGEVGVSAVSDAGARPQVRGEVGGAGSETEDTPFTLSYGPLAEGYVWKPNEIGFAEELWERYVGGAGSGVLCPHPDYAALMALYNATDGPNWTNNTGWVDGAAGTDCDPCGWYGIECDGNNRVRCIDLDGTVNCSINSGIFGNNLSGSIPPELGQLVNLEVLSLEWNSLTGSIPAELGQLTNLERLHLNGNLLAGSIPIELGHLINLEVLSLEFNSLTGSIPPELGQLTNLTSFWLFYNDLTDSIPAELGQLASLRSFQVHNNSLVGTIPLEFSQLSALTTLQVNNNMLSGSIPPELGQLASLERVILHNNFLVGSIPVELSQLGNLQRLLLHNNQLSGCFPNELLSICASLSPADTSQNSPTGYSFLGNPLLPYEGDYSHICDGDPQIGAPCNDGNPNTENDLIDADCNCVGTAIIPICDRNRDSLALVALYNSTNGPNWTNNNGWLTSAPLEDWFGVTTDEECVIELDLGLGFPGNNLIGTIPVELGQLQQLLVFDLSWNGLTGSIPLELGQLVNLEVLDLGGNDLTGSIPPELGQLASLKRLGLDNNDLTDTIPAELGELSNLHDLDLFANNLAGSIPSTLGQLSRLEILWLSGNDLTGSIPPELGQLESLRRFGLSGNDLTGLIPLSLGQLTNLENLSLQNNALMGSIPAELGQLSNLIFLGLTGNALTGSIPSELGQLANLRALDLDGNELTGPIPSELSYLANLERLLLADNELTGSIPFELGQLASLEQLLLMNNSLTGSIPSELGQLVNIERLLLNDNSLSGSIPSELGQLVHLELLWMHRNNLTGSIPAELGQLESLTNLWLSNNELMGSIPVELGQLSNLDRLLLHNNQLKGCFPEELQTICATLSPASINQQFPFGYSFLGNPLLPYEGDFERVCNGEPQIGAPCNDGNPNTENDLIDADCNCVGTAIVPICDRTRDSLALVALYNATDGPNWTRNDSWLSQTVPLQDWFGVGIGPGGCVDTLDLDGVDDNSDTTTPMGIGMRGPIPEALGGLRNLEYLFLTDNFLLTGGLPDTFYTLSQLRHVFIENIELTDSLSPQLINIDSLAVFDATFNKMTIGDLMLARDAYAAIRARDGFVNIQPQDSIFEPQTITLAVGEDLNLDLGYELLDNQNVYRWYRDDVLEQEVTGGTGTLTLTDVTSADAGIYYPRITNPGLPEVEMFGFGVTVVVEEPTCDDGVMNGEETGVDCGGPDCPSCGTCDDGIMNGEELGIDCGGPTCLPCGRCGENSPVSFSLGEDCGLVGDEICLPIFIDQFCDLGGIQFSLSYPTATLNYSRFITGNSLPESLVLDGGTDGTINAAWNDVTLNGISIEANEPVLELCFVVEQTAIHEFLIDHSTLRAFDSAGQRLATVWNGSLACSNTCFDGTQNGTETSVDCGGDCAPCDGCDRVRDSLALVALYNTTNGPGWTNNDGWLTSSPLEEWFGVTTDGNCVVELELGTQNNGNNLVGIIPTELGHLLNLRSLSLRENDLTGELPPELGRLSRLELLDLSSNDLTGEIPSELGQLSNLRTLKLQINDFVGGIPFQLGLLILLEDLSLSQNDLTSTIPSELGLLSNLKSLYLNSNDLVGSIPAELGGLESLEIFSLYSNSLTGEIPAELGELEKLTRLSLENNNLIGEIPAELGQLSRLRSLSFSDNELTGNIPAELGQLLELQTLSLERNNLTGEIPAELGQLVNLFNLWLQSNNLTGAIPAELGSLSNLGSLELFDNNLSSEIPSELGQLTSIRDFLLHNNRLEGCFPDELLFICGNLSPADTSQIFPSGYSFLNNPLLPYEGDFFRVCAGDPQIGAPCNDGNPNTISDVIQPDCTCGCPEAIPVILDTLLCQGEFITVNGTRYDLDNPNGTEFTTNLTGCDSIIQVTVTERPLRLDNRSATICEGESLEFYGETLTEADVYTATPTCDSIVRLTLEVLPAPRRAIERLICVELEPDFSLSVGGETFDQSNPTGEATVPALDGGCDSIISVNLIFQEPEIDVIDITTCFGAPLEVGGMPLTADRPVIRDTFVQPGECNRYREIRLTFRNDFDTLRPILCGEETFLFGGVEYSRDNPTGVHVSEDEEDGQNCPLTTFIEATPSEPYDSSLTLTLCANEFILVGGQRFDRESPSGEATILNLTGDCDTIVDVALTFDELLSGTVNLSACAGATVDYRGLTLSEDNPLDSLVAPAPINSGDCDSLLVVSVTFTEVVRPPEIALAACPGDVVTVGGQDYTEPGLYQDTLRSTNGCDSVINTIRIEPLQQYADTLRQSICQGEVVPFGDTSYGEPGVYDQTLQSVAGCDSTITLVLTVLPTYSVMIDTTLCPGDSLMVGDTRFDESNPSDTLFFQTEDNCDSTVIVTVGYYPDWVLENLEVDLCEGDSLFYGDSLITTEGGIYELFVKSEETGCDSLLLLWDVAIVEGILVQERDTICEGEELAWRDLLLTATGTYEVNGVDAVGNCDTLYRLDLLVIDPDAVFLTPDSYELLRSDEFILLDVLENDSIPYDFELSIPVMPTKGTLEQQGDSLLFFPDGFSSGPDSFLYKVCLEHCPDFCRETMVRLSIDFNCILEFTINTPNGFTPNGDGLNDVFDPLASITGECLDQLGEVRLAIRNIQSELVYQTEDVYFPWDGTNRRGNPLPPGTYFYIFEVEGLEEPISGPVELVR